MIQRSTTGKRPSAEGCGLWTVAEHQRFLQALQVYPNGPWRAVAEFVGTRNVRQTMTHAQKHKQKIERHERGLRTRRHTHRESQQSRHKDKESDHNEMPPVLPSSSVVYPTLGGSRDDAIQTPDVPSAPPLPYNTPTFGDMLRDAVPGGSSSVSIAALAAPLSFCGTSAFDDDDDDHFVLATPVVSDCLDFLVRSFAS